MMMKKMNYICLVLAAIFIMGSDAFEENQVPYRHDILESVLRPNNKRPFKPNCNYVCHPDPEPTPFFSIGGTDVKPQKDDPFYEDSYLKYKRYYKSLYGKLLGFGDGNQSRSKFAPLPFNSNI